VKSFILGLVAAVVLAAGAGFVLEGYFSQEAEQAFATSSTRIDPASEHAKPAERMAAHR
jgi:hypothetical protein